jgi:type VI secretion system protein VasJ
MKARRNALEWWLEKTASGLNGLEPGTLPEEEVATVLEDLRGFDQYIGEHMEDAPALSTLMDRIGSLQAPTPEEKTPPRPEVVESPAPASAPSPAAAQATQPLPVSMQNEEDAQRSLRAASQRLSEVASFYLSGDLFHPLGYLLGRAAAWMGVTEPPPSKGSKTLIPPPPEYLKEALDKLSREGDWEGLVRAAEARTGEFLFWLDLSRYSAQALERLGHPQLGELVSKEAALYVARLKGIEGLCFSDGTPFASTETKVWLDHFSLTGARKVPMETPDDSADQLEGSIEREYQQALDLQRDGKLDEAVDKLHRRVSKGSSGKERLLWRSALSRLLIVAGEGRTALPYLREVIRDVAHHRLEEWDPELALRILLGVYSGLMTLKDDQFQDQTVELLDRIAALNPAEAMRLRK